MERLRVGISWLFGFENILDEFHQADRRMGIEVISHCT